MFSVKQEPSEVVSSDFTAERSADRAKGIELGETEVAVAEQ